MRVSPSLLTFGAAAGRLAPGRVARPKCHLSTTAVSRGLPRLGVAPRAYLPKCERHGHRRAAAPGHLGCLPGVTLHTEKPHCNPRQKKLRKCAKKKSGNLAKKNLRIAQKKSEIYAKKKIKIVFFLFQEPSQWFSKIGFWGRMLAGRKSRRMYWRRPLPGLIGNQKFEQKKSKTEI